MNRDDLNRPAERLAHQVYKGYCEASGTEVCQDCFEAGYRAALRTVVTATLEVVPKVANEAGLQPREVGVAGPRKKAAKKKPTAK